MDFASHRQCHSLMVVSVTVTGKAGSPAPLLKLVVGASAPCAHLLRALEDRIVASGGKVLPRIYLYRRCLILPLHQQQSSVDASKVDPGQQQGTRSLPHQARTLRSMQVVFPEKRRK